MDSGLTKAKLDIQEVSEDFYDETQEIELAFKEEEKIVGQVPEIREDLSVKPIII